ncbi:MAG: LysE/ArgO family amino acid transporter [Pseudoruegeria sp.]
MSAFYSGFALSFGLILAIGAQNAFVLRQGLRNEHVLPIVLCCAVSDAILIALGVSGFGVLAAQWPWLIPTFRYGGAAFLIFYGIVSFRAAYQGGEALEAADRIPAALLPTVLTCLALTWLNPHVYLDTLMLIGSISTQFEGQKIPFGIGAVLASFVFFFSLGYGAALLRGFFAKPSAWRILDVFVGTTMWLIAAKLLLH